MASYSLGPLRPVPSDPGCFKRSGGGFLAAEGSKTTTGSVKGHLGSFRQAFHPVSIRIHSSTYASTTTNRWNPRCFKHLKYVPSYGPMGLKFSCSPSISMTEYSVITSTLSSGVPVQGGVVYTGNGFGATNPGSFKHFT